jgi:pimeloyl-ACP methyl ester carboxylesterase
MLPSTIMPSERLTEERLCKIQSDALADDIPIDWATMKDWTEADAIRFFESGGEEVPSVSPAALERKLKAALPALGHTNTALLPGEEKGRTRGCFRPKPDARVRFFVLYGVADVAVSCQAWIRAAPEWLEVRVLDYPGHGFRAAEPLPSCSASANGRGLDEVELRAQRAALVTALTRDIVKAAAGKPFALYGFSFGALLAYGVALELSRSAGGPQPLLLCVAGRGAPHCEAFSRLTCERIANSDTEGMLSWQQGGGAFRTSTIPAPMRERAAALFRCGMLLGAMPAGHLELSSRLPDLADEEFFTMPKGTLSHVTDPPRLERCPLIAIGSDGDVVWPASLVEFWAEVATDFVGRTLQAVAHAKLMNHSETMRICFAEVGVAALRLARTSSSDQ